MLAFHWTAKLTKGEMDVLRKFSCSDQWLASFEHEWEVQDLEVDGAPKVNASFFNEEEMNALAMLEASAYVWPLGDGVWCLDEYGLPIWLALHGRESSCTIEIE